MARWSWMVLLLVVAIGCGDSGGDFDAAADRFDAASVARDAAGSDAPPGPDAAAAPDGATPDGAPPDAGPADAEPGGACGVVGMACSEGKDCGVGYECVISTGGRFCSKQRPGCGGFAGDTCDDPSAPLCHYLPSADYGPCLTEYERDCICTRSPGSILGCP